MEPPPVERQRAQSWADMSEDPPPPDPNPWVTPKRTCRAREVAPEMDQTRHMRPQSRYDALVGAQGGAMPDSCHYSGASSSQPSRIEDL